MLTKIQTKKIFIEEKLVASIFYEIKFRLWKEVNQEGSVKNNNIMYVGV